jgi:hypothetical protein
VHLYCAVIVSTYWRAVSILALDVSVNANRQIAKPVAATKRLTFHIVLIPALPLPVQAVTLQNNVPREVLALEASAPQPVSEGI